jgi:hypothetical protein
MTLMLPHPCVEVGESLCVTCEACIHALEGAQVPHDHVGMTEYFFNSECIFWILHQLVSPSGGGSQHRDSSRSQLEPVVAGIFFYHILSPCCTCTLPWKLERACVLRLNLAFMSQRAPRSPMIKWG